MLSLLHDDITDFEDYIPAGSGLDTPGNVPHATNNQVSLTGTIPLDFLGLKNGLLKPTFTWYQSSLADPVTGIARRFSGQRDRRIFMEIDQDIEAWNSTWQFGIGPSFSNTVWRISQISLVTIHNPYDYFSWTWHAAPDLSLQFEVDNIVPYRFEQETDQLRRATRYRRDFLDPGRLRRHPAQVICATPEDILSRKTFMIRMLAAFAILMALTPPCLAQSPDRAAILKSNGVPSVWFAMIQNRRIVRTEAFGKQSPRNPGHTSDALQYRLADQAADGGDPVADGLGREH